MSDFRSFSEGDMYGLTPEQLLAYYLRARREGHDEDARRAAGVLVWMMEDRVRFWASRKLHSEELQDLEVIVGEVFLSVVRDALKFEGKDMNAFGAWLRQHSFRRAYDYLRQRMRTADETPLLEEHEGDEEMWGESPSIDDPTKYLVARSVVDQALDELNPVHRRVCELSGPKEFGLDGAPAKETAQIINDQFSGELNDPMTDVNVYQIVSRFRKRVEQIASEAEGKAEDG